MSDASTPATRDDTAFLSRALSLAFGSPVEDVERWIDETGLEHCRVLRDPGPTACFIRLPMGHYFGGRSVPALGVAGVATPPESRGRGAARRLMAAGLREARGEGLVLSSLFASTQALYRSLGYETSGLVRCLSLGRDTLSLLRPEGRPDRVRAAEEADRPAVAELYARAARELAGMCDRNEYLWRRTRSSRGKRLECFVTERDGAVTGALAYRTEEDPDVDMSAFVHELVFADEPAARTLLSLLGSLASTIRRVDVPLHPGSPLPLLIPENWTTTRWVNEWYLRVVDVAGALSARGYPAGVHGELEIGVTDDVLPENAGVYRLRVEGGEGACERVGEDAGSSSGLRVDVRDLAPMYSGHLSPAALARAGRLKGPAGAMGLASALFAAQGVGVQDLY